MKQGCGHEYLQQQLVVVWGRVAGLDKKLHESVLGQQLLSDLTAV